MGPREVLGAAWGLPVGGGRAGVEPAPSWPCFLGGIHFRPTIAVSDLGHLLRFKSLWFLPRAAKWENFSLVQNDAGSVSV